MNRCRRMAALQARAFADAGWLVLQIDLMGCGDSAGDFADATWSQWVDDVTQSASWLRERCGSAPVLWGLRAGALIAVEAAARFEVGGFVLWQPVLSGKQFLQQFLRLKAAGEMVAQGDRERTGTRALRERLGRGESVEIAGYTVSSQLALGLEAAELEPHAQPTRVVWREVAGSSTTEVGPASRTRLQRWQESGHRVDARVVEGPQFWQTLNITEAPALVTSTITAVESW
jgi:exosortase A-associated hydrolase 2